MGKYPYIATHQVEYVIKVYFIHIKKNYFEFKKKIFTKRNGQNIKKARPFWHLLKKISTNRIVLIKNSSKLNSLSNSKILLTNPIIYFYFIVIAYITIAKGYGLFLSKTSLVLPWSVQPQFFRS